MDRLRTLWDLPKIVTPYALHPLQAAEVFLPHFRPVSWFTDSGRFEPGRDIPPLDGKTILVTGGNAGLGLETITQLAKHNPQKIYLAARSSQKASQAISLINERLARETPGVKANIEFIHLDLAELETVERAAQTIFAGTQRLDIVILNAGVMATPPSKTKLGIDSQLGVNYVGHFLLVNLLMPLLEQTAADPEHADVRVVSVSSEAYHMAPSNLMDVIEDHEKLCSSSEYTRYGVSKAANILFAAELARRTNNAAIRSVSLHPGVILTQLYDSTQDSNVILKMGLPTVSYLLFDDVAHGALGQIYLAAGVAKENIVNGAYYTPVGRLQSISLTEDVNQAGRLWKWTYTQLKDYLP